MPLRRALLALACMSILAASELAIPLLPEPPQIDGSIAPAEAAGCARLDGFIDSGLMVRRRARVLIGATPDAFYLAIQTQLPDAGAPLLAAVAADSTRVVFDDSVEVYVSPTPDATDKTCYQFLANSLGRGGYNVHKQGAAGESEAWQGPWRHAHRCADGLWTAEFLIPIRSMAGGGGDRAITSGSWLINATRNWKPDWGWSALGNGYAHAGIAVRVQPDAPLVACRMLGDPTCAPATIELEVANPGKAPLPLKAELRLVRNNMPELGGARDLVLAPGARETLRIPLEASDPTTIFELAAKVASADGKRVFLDRPLKWNRAKAPLAYAGGAAKVAPALDLAFAYYPSEDRLRVVADIAGMPATARLAQVAGVVRRAGGGAVVDRFTIPAAAFAKGRAEIERTLPPLDGAYELALVGEGEGVPAGEAVKAFERRRFAWEGNPMGRSTTVYPPFTPIAIEGGHLRTVLRDHVLNGVGLFDQVTATSAQTGIAKPILAAPMRYLVSAGGRTVAAEAAAPARVVESAGHRAVTAGSFAGGALRADWRGTWDYDGCLRVDLTLKAGAQPVDALTLEIPLDPATATMIHANSDRIRAPIARRIGDQPGIQWTAKELACDDYIKNFAPYVFVGDGVRGLCWFAENDRGWGWDPATPNATLAREDGRVVLRLALIDRPTVIDADRTITFGLLAAPVKPRVVAAGQGPDWWRYRYLREKGTLLGTDVNWGAINSCGAVYPAGIPLGEDLSVWDLIRRGNLGEVPKAEVEAAIARLKPITKDHDQQMWEEHLRRNVESRRGATMYFYYNRASAQIFPEFETFKDEWGLDDLRSTGKGDSAAEIKIVPSPSYIDHALWWYAKSFELGGNHGVYWDNWFIAPSFNTHATAAYRRADGTVCPASGIWGLRELARRTWVMMNERGMTPVTFPHMTSFSCLPMLSFATMQYDWEWKYSEGDVQDRFSRAYLLLASSGELAGTWPNPLHDQLGKAEDPWTQRTFTAVRILHELDGVGGFGFPWVKAHQDAAKLWAPIGAMLDQPGLQVWRYWDDRPLAVRSPDPDLPSIVYAVPGREAVVAVVSYHREPAECALAVDAKALGFAAGFTAIDALSGEAVAVQGGGLAPFALKGHDIRVLRLTPAGR